MEFLITSKSKAIINDLFGYILSARMNEEYASILSQLEIAIVIGFISPIIDVVIIVTIYFYKMSLRVGWQIKNMLLGQRSVEIVDYLTNQLIVVDVRIQRNLKVVNEWIH